VGNRLLPFKIGREMGNRRQELQNGLVEMQEIVI